MEATPQKPMLPPRFAQWFAARGWAPHAHQLAMLAAARAGKSALLIAPTGGGKTLSGFLPSLIALAEAPTCATSRRTARSHRVKSAAISIRRRPSPRAASAFRHRASSSTAAAW
jgi:ATP-dependent Lhr-like helicase